MSVVLVLPSGSRILMMEHGFFIFRYYVNTLIHILEIEAYGIDPFSLVSLPVSLFKKNGIIYFLLLILELLFGKGCVSFAYSESAVFG